VNIALSVMSLCQVGGGDDMRGLWRVVGACLRWLMIVCVLNN
jgi:hypothetical protein